VGLHRRAAGLPFLSRTDLFCLCLCLSFCSLSHVGSGS
jgi:hypothetical protein